MVNIPNDIAVREVFKNALDKKFVPKTNLPRTPTPFVLCYERNKISSTFVVAVLIAESMIEALQTNCKTSFAGLSFWSSLTPPQANLGG